MKIGKLARDPSLLPKLPKKATIPQEAESKARAEFLLARARAGLVANPTWQGADPDEVKTANVAALKTLLTTEVGDAAAKVATLKTAMADTTQTELVDVDDASIDPPQAAANKQARFRLRYSALFGRGPQQLRATAISSAAWTHLAEDPTLSDADLHTLVSRRLMIAERMLWYVGSAGERAWKKTGNKWNGKDGWERMFEYARLPVTEPLIATCNAPAASATCDPAGGLKDWTRQTRYTHDYKVVDEAKSKWKRAPAGSYWFYFDNSAGNDPIDSITKLFKAHDDFRERNLLNCDHVIHCLHLEALARVKSKRDANTTWLKTLVDAEADGWLRIYAPFADDDYTVATIQRKYLGSKFEPRFFELKRITVSELAVGDHVIVYNHPAYDKCKDPDDVWRLENAIVVTKSPRLLLQGHGTNPIPFTSTLTVPVKGGKRVPEPSMRRDMIGLFNAKLEELRARARTENNAATPQSPIALPGAGAELMIRTVPSFRSDYDPAEFTPNARKLARWWLRWDRDTDPDSLEARIAADSDWANWVWALQFVEIIGSNAYFPLWRPKPDKSGGYVRVGGLISDMTPTWVSQDMTPGWDWYYQNNESPELSAPHRVAVRRPKVS